MRKKKQPEPPLSAMWTILEFIGWEQLDDYARSGTHQHIAGPMLTLLRYMHEFPSHSEAAKARTAEFWKQVRARRRGFHE
jgi:hypothetical protein